jgi:SAM-dependent methyltransferase
MESSSFDTILIADVLEHIANPEVFMKEMARLLKPNGKLLIMIPFFYWIHEAPHDYARYTEYALRQFCIKNNLSVIYLKPYGGLPDILLDLINKQFVKNENRVRIFMKICSIITRTAWYKNTRSATANHFPLGYCLVAKK